MDGMKTLDEVRIAVDRLALISLQTDITKLQYATLCGMIVALSWVLNERDFVEQGGMSNALAKLLERGFISTPECN